METQDFKKGWLVQIIGHRKPEYNYMLGFVINVKKHVIQVELEFADFTEVVPCLPHELVIKKRN